MLWIRSALLRYHSFSLRHICDFKKSRTGVSFKTYLLWRHAVKIAWYKMEGFSDTPVCIKYFWSTPLSQRLAIPLCTAALSLPSLPFHPRLQRLGWVGGRKGGEAKQQENNREESEGGKHQEKIQMSVLAWSNFFNISSCKEFLANRPSSRQKHGCERWRTR